VSTILLNILCLLIFTLGHLPISPAGQVSLTAMLLLIVSLTFSIELLVKSFLRLFLMVIRLPFDVGGLVTQSADRSDVLASIFVLR